MKRICKKVRKNLPAFINNQLDKEKVKTIEQHFNICPICRKEAEDIRLTWNLLAEHTIEKDFPDLTNSILEYIEREGRKVSLFQNIIEKFTLLPAPALCLLIFLLGIPPGVFLGKNLYPTLSSLYPQHQREAQNVYAEEMPWDIFSDLPSQSLGDVYLNITTDYFEEEQ
ncbi:MAG: zf-HC2 domain-containing protein [Deltaproteobacteria bacterium]|nr:zf-HC2 domain-containing protein [Deltaproteobacteria bacterium]